MYKQQMLHCVIQYFPVFMCKILVLPFFFQLSNKKPPNDESDTVLVRCFKQRPDGKYAMLTTSYLVDNSGIICTSHNSCWKPGLEDINWQFYDFTDFQRDL